MINYTGFIVIIISLWFVIVIKINSLCISFYSLIHVFSSISADSQSAPVPQTTPAYIPATTPAYVPTTPAPVPTSTGYNYPVPDVTLPIRPVTTPAPIITTPATLYGAPPPSRSGRNGRRGGRKRNGRRRGRGRRVKVLRKRL